MESSGGGDGCPMDEEGRPAVEPLAGPRSVDRRRVALGLAAGVGAAWVAPAVLQVSSAAAQGSSPPDFINGVGDYGVPGAPPITLEIPPGTFQVGDLILGVGGIRFDDAKNAGIDPPPGFVPVVPSTSPSPGTPGGLTSRPTPLGGSAPEALRGYVWWKFYAGETFFTFDKTIDQGFPTRWAVGVLGFSGASGVGASAGQGNITAGVVQAPSITTTAAGSTIVYIGLTPGVTSWVGPSGYTFRAQGPTNGSHPEGYVATRSGFGAGASVGTAQASVVQPADPPVDDSLGFHVEILA